MEKDLLPAAKVSGMSQSKCRNHIVLHYKDKKINLTGKRMTFNIHIQHTKQLRAQENNPMRSLIKGKGKGKVFPLQAWCGPEGG